MKTHRWGPMCLKSHHRVDILFELNNIKDVMHSCSRNVNILNNKSGRTFVVFFTTNSLSDDPNIYFFANKKSFFLNFLSMKVTFKVIVYICD